MEDLVPLIFFLIIVAVNVFKFFIEKGGTAKKTPNQPREAPPKRVSSLESFFEDLAKQVAPKPTELPDWPEGRGRPDYLEEMEEFEAVRAETHEEEETAEIIPIPPPQPNPVLPVKGSGIETASLKSAMKAMPSMITNSQGMRIASAPILRSSAAGHIDFPMKNKTELRKAIIANIIFSPPRVYDVSFDNSITQ